MNFTFENTHGCFGLRMGDKDLLPPPYGYNFVILTFKCCFFHFYWLPVVQQHAEWPHLKDRVGNERAIGQLKIEEMMENDYCGET